MKKLALLLLLISFSGYSQRNTHQKWDDLLKKNVSAAGTVDYKAFKKQEALLDVYLIDLAKEIPQEGWSKNATLAYWINVYNAYTVKLILNNYPTKSIKDISDPWGKKFFTLANKKYSLEEVEHEILRKMNEPRIHFAINCASYSCPNLLNEAYTEEKVESQLDKAAKGFVNDKTKNVISAKEVQISEIFNWFSGDFKTKETNIIDFLNKYSTVTIDKKAKIKFLEYNWKLNE